MSFTKGFQNYFEIWWNGIKSLPETTSIHGFRFIADNKRNWTERIFWTVFVALCWYGSALLIAAQYDAFRNNPISFVVETTYKDWNTNFPSIAICENDNSARVGAMAERILGEDYDYNMEETLKEIVYFKGYTYYINEFCKGDPQPACHNWNLTYYANLLRSPCAETLWNCSWNTVSFKCCDYFKPLDTELGVCYVVNTIQRKEKAPADLKMVSNKETGPGVLNFNVLVPAKVFVLNEEEVPSLTLIGLDAMVIEPETFYKRIISIRNIDNDAGARFISPKKRKCRYIDENNLDVYPYYSYTACTVQCRKDIQLRLCNCTNFYMPNVPEHMKCDVDGIICLNTYVNQLSTLKAKWSSRPGLDCNCLPSCTEAELTIVKDFKMNTEENYTSIQIKLATLPSERYRRNVVRGALDLVVSTGGTGGLFLGVSILSFVELFYIVLIRPFCDIYSRLGDDPWYKKFGNRRLEDNKFKLATNRKKDAKPKIKRHQKHKRRTLKY